MDVIIVLTFTAILGLVGFIFGRRAERLHYAQIEAGEQASRDILITTVKRIPSNFVDGQSCLVVGSVVIAEDYFKRMAAGLRNFFGGRVVSYESLLDRARREAVLRMKAEARAVGARAVFNVRFETSSLSDGNPKALFSAEVLCYGTAIVMEAAPPP